MKPHYLIIYEPISQKSLIDRLIREMNKRGLDIDAFNLFEMRYHNRKTTGGVFIFARTLQKWIVTRRLNKTILYPYILKNISNGVDYIDVHYFSHEYVRFLEKYKKPYKLTIWGSDFYRETLYWQEKKRNIYKRAESIQVATTEVKKSLTQYDALLTDKIVVCNFGVNLLPIIDKYKDEGEPLVKNPCNKIMITCGYNGTPGQQHLEIFRAISGLPEEIQRRIILLIPATYGLRKQYEKEMHMSLVQLPCESYMFKKRLSESDLAKLRIQTDIVINIQITDALSASLIEHLYAGNILIAGNWLRYGMYDRHQIKYWQTSEQELSATLMYTINNLHTLKDECKGNHDKIKEFASWESVSELLFQTYLNIK